jgi:hypothetical protein
MLLYCSYRISRARETSGYWCSIGNIKRKELLLYWFSTKQSIDICCSLEYTIVTKLRRRLDHWRLCLRQTDHVWLVALKLEPF